MEKQYVEELCKLLSKAVGEELPNERVALLFSGGIDSALLALLLKRAGAEFVCYTTAVQDIVQAQDLEAAQKAAKEIDAELRVAGVSVSEVEGVLGQITQILGQSGVVHAGVGAALYCSLKRAEEDGCRVAYSGLGADELFAGYAEFRERGAERAVCEEFLQRLYANDLPRDRAVAGALGMQLRLPYLDESVVEFALSLPGGMKLSKTGNKIVLRRAAEKIGLPKEIAQRAKKAAQYGSGVDKAVEWIAREHGFKSKGEYIESLGMWGAANGVQGGSGE